jgi:CopG family nickel-responsive transcriptional regulator
MHMKLIRFGVSLPEELIQKFDRLTKRKRYANRSEAIRDLIRRELVHEDIASDRVVAGVLSLLYDHHKTAISETLNALQHDYHKSIISTTHVHLDHDARRTSRNSPMASSPSKASSMAACI